MVTQTCVIACLAHMNMCTSKVEERKFHYSTLEKIYCQNKFIVESAWTMPFNFAQ
jgi:hypothetical protein